MKRGIVTLESILPAGLLADLTEKNCKNIKAPLPKPPKVIGDPTRDPANKQAAMMLAKASWIYQPLPPETNPVGLLDRLRNENASLKLKNLQLQLENAALKKKLKPKPKATPSILQPEHPISTPVGKTDKQKTAERLGLIS